jgi:hypothetical protein
MNVRLYFDRSYAPLSAPARITVSDFKNTAVGYSDLPLSCEVSTDGTWRKNWKEVRPSERAEHLVFALHKLGKQQLRAKDALGIKHNDHVRMAIADSNSDHAGVILELTKNVIGSSEFWSLSLEFLHHDLTSEMLGWDRLRTLYPFPYEHLLREAVVRFMREEAEMKVKHGLQETAHFEDLELALKVTGDRYRTAKWSITAHEPSQLRTLTDPRAQRFLEKCRQRVEREFNGRNSVMVSFCEAGNRDEQYTDAAVKQVARVLEEEGRHVLISEMAIYISNGAVSPVYWQWHGAQVQRLLDKCRNALAQETIIGGSVMVSFCEAGKPDEQYTDAVVEEVTRQLRSEGHKVKISELALYIEAASEAVAC